MRHTYTHVHTHIHAHIYAETHAHTQLNIKRLGDLGVCYLAAGLINGGTCSVQSLCVPNVDMGAEGARAIATALYFNDRLKEVNISLNKIGEDGAQYLL